MQLTIENFITKNQYINEFLIICSYGSTSSPRTVSVHYLLTSETNIFPFALPVRRSLGEVGSMSKGMNGKIIFYSNILPDASYAMMLLVHTHRTPEIYVLQRHAHPPAACRLATFPYSYHTELRYLAHPLNSLDR